MRVHLRHKRFQGIAHEATRRIFFRPSRWRLLAATAALGRRGTSSSAGGLSFSWPTGRVTSKGHPCRHKLCFDAVNARGGVRGRAIRLVTRDDAKPRRRAPDARADLPPKRRWRLIGTVGTANLEARWPGWRADATARLDDRRGVRRAASVVRASGMHIVKRATDDEVGSPVQLNSPAWASSVSVWLDGTTACDRDVLAGAKRRRRNTASSWRRAVRLRAQHGGRREGGGRHGERQRCRWSFSATTAARHRVRPAVRCRRRAGHAVRHVHHRHRCAAEGARADVRAAMRSRWCCRWRSRPSAVVRSTCSCAMPPKDANLSARSIEGFIAAKALVKVLKAPAA